MDKIQQAINQCLQEVRRKTDADFAAFACQEPGQAVIRWKYAVGNQNERFRRIVLRSGKGIAGKVLMSGRLMLLENYKPGQYDDPREYPILYAEELQSAMAVPVMMQDRVKGVLLIGYRTPCRIEEKIIDLTKQIADQMAELLTS